MAEALCWGAKVSPEFRAKVFALCARLRLNPDYLMACMAFETGERFTANVRNGAGSGAVGLIQFMPATARGLGVESQALALMTPERQLDYVEAYFRPYAKRLTTLADHYMAILLPSAIARPESAPLWFAGTIAYRQNAGLDLNADGRITKAEATAKVHAKLVRGMAPGRVWQA